MNKKLTKSQQAIKEAREYKANDIFTHKMAYEEVSKINQDRFMGSGVIISIQSISGANIMTPVMISDGLSDETIEAIRRDIKRSQDLRLAMATIGSKDSK